MSNDFQALLARIESLEAKVQEVRDREEICNLETRYAEACDLGYNADAMVELFTPDAVWEFTNEWRAHRGHKEIHLPTFDKGHYHLLPCLSGKTLCDRSLGPYRVNLQPRAVRSASYAQRHFSRRELKELAAVRCESRPYPVGTRESLAREHVQDSR
jgi:hypothetical protein